MEIGTSVWPGATLLLFVMDPFGNVPLVLALLKDIDPARRRWIISRELLIALVVLLVFLASPTLYRVLRERGLQAIERLMGMLLIMIAVQMMLNGLGSAF